VGGSVAVAVSVSVAVAVGGSVAVAVGVSVAVAVGVSVAVAVGVSVAVAVGGIMVVATGGRFVGVLLGIQPPCIILPEINSFSGDETMDGNSCRREALTPLNERQANGINNRIINTSSANRRIVERFFLLSIRTS
jgi:hypothetical protein